MRMHYTLVVTALLAVSLQSRFVRELAACSEGQNEACSIVHVDDEWRWCDRNAWRAIIAEREMHARTQERIEAEQAVAETKPAIDSASPVLKRYPSSWRVSSSPQPETALIIRLDWLPEGEEKLGVAIYDLNGQPVRRLLHGEQAQEQTMLIWDGKDEAGQAVLPGKYWYRIQTEKRIYSKMLVVR